MMVMVMIMVMVMMMVMVTVARYFLKIRTYALRADEFECQVRPLVNRVLSTARRCLRRCCLRRSRPL